LGSFLFLLAVLGLPDAIVADEPNQAGLAIQFGDGRVETRCVPFAEEEITGADLLLTYSGLETIVDASSGMGITVCQLEGEGCTYPAEACFCQCMGGGECAYWNYFYREPDSSEWTYSALGAVLRKVRHGSVEAWVWGDGTEPPSFEGSFESMCAAPTVEPSATMKPTTAVEPSAAPEQPTAGPTAAATLPPSAEPPEPASTTAAPPTNTVVLPTPTQMPEAAPAQTLASYWPFGLMVLGLVAIGLFVRFRRG
jgi:hypothetical protein